MSSVGHAGGPELRSEKDRVLYALGVKLMLELAPFQLNSKELAVIQRGMRASMKGEYEVDPAKYRDGIDELARTRVMRRAESEKRQGAEYIAKAAKMPGAQKSLSGLVWFELKKGTGPKPHANSTVRAHYRGTLIDGTEFDSSFSRGEPAEFPLDRVIPCWTDGMTQLNVGAKARFVCPAAIAYGDQGAAPVVPPGATLIFEVELLGIVDPSAKKGAPTQ